jgi:predicted PurR-regulated permease PerM
MKKKIIKYIILATVFLVCIIIIYKSAIVKEVLYLVFMSFIIAYTIKPLQKLLIKRGINKRLAAAMLLVAFVICVVLILVVIIPSIFRESLNVNSSFIKLEQYLNDFYNKLKPLKNNKTLFAILDSIYGKINLQFTSMLNKVLDNALSLGENLISLAVIPIVVYYFLADSDIIFNRLIVIFPCKSRSIIKKILNHIDKIMGRYIISQFLLCLLIGVLTFFILIFLKVDFPIILSLLNAAFNIIPYFGPLFGALPAVFMALLISPKTAIYTAICLQLIQQLEGDVISPKITGDSVSMHPLLIIIILIIGGKIGGFIGMVLAVPIGVIIKIIYEDLNYYLF